MSSHTIAARLRTADHELARSPTLWFPHTRSWVASSPYDAGWTYLASAGELAYELRTTPGIEALPCSYHEA